MKKLFIQLAAWLLASVTIAANADQSIIYINGVYNSRADVQETARLIAGILKDSNNHQNASKQTFNVSFIFNPQGYAEDAVNLPGCALLCQDIRELAVLKFAEEDYAPFFSQILAPHNSSNIINKEAATEVKRYADSLVLGSNNLLASGAVSIEKMTGTKKALDSLIAKIKNNTNAVVVAHSQGNLLANLAWASLAAELGQEVEKRMIVINLANTSKFSVNGLNITHNADSLLVDFKDVATLFGFTRDTAFTRSSQNCSTGQCQVVLAEPTFISTGNIYCISPFCNHYMTTYLSDSNNIDLNPPDQGVSLSTGKTLFRDRFEDFIYAASISLAIKNGAGNLVSKDIWTTNVYSYAPGGGGPGGGLDDDRLIVGGWGDEYRSLIQFDLSGQPKAVTSVILRLFDISTNAGSNGPTPMYLYQITSSWDWTTQPITAQSPDNLRLWWVNQPTAVLVGAYGSRSAILPAPSVGATYDINITDIYNFWQSNPALNFGIELRPQYTSNYWNVFASSQNATAAQRPQLIITP